MTFPEVEAELEARGFAPGRPRRRGLIDGPALDAEITATSTCEACGHIGLDYYAYVNSDQY